MEKFNWLRKGVNEEVTIGHHGDNLHDLNEDVSGQKIDEATGQAIDNAGDQMTEDTKVYEYKRQPGSKDVMGALPAVEDDADKWLRENDPKYKKAA